LIDVEEGQVVYRPGVARVEDDRPLELLDRPGRVAELVLEATEQAVTLARRGVDPQRRFDVREGLLWLALLHQHAAQVDVALQVGRVLLERPSQRFDRSITVARLPGGERSEERRVGKEGRVWGARDQW